MPRKPSFTRLQIEQLEDRNVPSISLPTSPSIPDPSWMQPALTAPLHEPLAAHYLSFEQLASARAEAHETLRTLLLSGPSIETVFEAVDPRENQEWSQAIFWEQWAHEQRTDRGALATTLSAAQSAVAQSQDTLTQATTMRVGAEQQLQTVIQEKADAQT